MQYPYQIKSLEQYKEVYKKSVDDPEEFWAGIAENFQWRKKWHQVLEWNFTGPDVKWFIGAKLNITENCLDRWAKIQPDVPALYGKRTIQMKQQELLLINSFWKG